MINVLDIETYKEENEVKPYCICLNLNETDYHFFLENDTDVVIDCLNTIINKTLDDKIEIYIHNLNFDGFLIIDSLTKNLINFKLYSDKAKIFMMRIDYCSKFIYLKCSYKIIPIGLRELGLLENFKKKFFPHKFIEKTTLLYSGQIPTPEFWENKDYDLFLKGIEDKEEFIFNVKNEAISYCKNDVLLTKRVLKNLFLVIDQESKTIRKKSLSAPSMSYNIFIKKYNNFEIKKKLKIDEDLFIRNSYFGGRCEIFGNIYKGEIIKYFDFSGMYGQCMLENFHYGESKFISTKNIDKPGFYNIDYESKFDNLPILPCHYNEKLIFANGKRNGTFWFEEIIFFEKMGGKILKINNAFVYDNYGKVFKDFVDKFNEIRVKGGYYKIFGKLMINSLYGGMGLKKKDYCQYITFSEEEFNNISYNTNVLDFHRINNCFIIIISEDYKSKRFFNNIDDYEEMSMRNVSYSSAIASKARIKLYNGFLEVIKDGGRLLYCDTDSIFAAYNEKNKKEKAGDIKWLEYYEDGVFAAPKTYAISNKKEEIVKIKGIDIKNMNLNELKHKFYENKTIKFKDQLNFRKADFNLRQFYIEKEIALGDYKKRIFIKDKKETIPIEI